MRRQMQLDEMTKSFRREFKNIDELFSDVNAPGLAVPKIIFVANKAEDGYEGDILAEFFQKFPHAASDPSCEPIFISAEHGDGLPDLYHAIKESIPAESKDRFEDRKEKRVHRYLELKEQLMDEIVQFKIDVVNSEQAKKEKDPSYKMKDEEDSEDDIEMFVRQWEKDFDRANKDPEYNSDFDSDNDVNPIDTVEQLNASLQKPVGKISSEGNPMLRKPVQLSVIGKPNVGKSTFVNSLLREHRVVANDMAGTTRDCIQVQWSWNGRRILLVDTAGIKPGTGQPKDRLEVLVNEQVSDSLNYSHVVCVMIDCMQAFTSVDMQIIDRVLEEGRALVIVANRWDLVEDKYKKKAVQWMEKQLERGLGQAKGIPIAFVSAKTGTRVDTVMQEVMRVYEKWNTRVSTGLLNKWIYEFSKVQRMPQENGKRLKLKYLMQIRTRPPAFFVFCNRKALVTDNFEQYLRHCISKEFGFIGVPIRILLRDARSQYSAKKMSSASASVRKVLERIHQYQQKKANPTARRRTFGNRQLYQKGFRAKSYKDFKRY